MSGYSYDARFDDMTTPQTPPMDEWLGLIADTLIDALDDSHVDADDDYGWLRPSAKPVILAALRQAAAKGREQMRLRAYAALEKLEPPVWISTMGGRAMAAQGIQHARATIRALPTEDEPTS